RHKEGSALDERDRASLSRRAARSAWRFLRHTLSEQSCELPRARPSGGAYRTLRKCLYCRSDSAEGGGDIRRFVSCRNEYHKRVARARTPAPTSWLVVSKWDSRRQ